MLSTFPYPYPEETLYSLIARYNMYSGNLNYKHTIQDLYGETARRSNPEFTSGIETLLNRIPQIGLSAEDIIYNHTTFPFYSAFIPQDRVRKMEIDMIASKRSELNTSIGINASSITNFRYLKHCRICMLEDDEQYGETYWHRVHQIPSVLVCPKHKHPLTKLDKQLYETNQHEFLLASTDIFDYSNEPVYLDETLEELNTFSQEAQWLLNNKVIVPDYNFYRDNYISLLKEKKIASINGRVNQKEWKELFSQYFNEEFLTLMESNINDQSNNWLASIVRKHRKVFHPIRHILIIMLLNGGLKNFYNKKHQFLPFGNGPWPCLNPAHKLYRKKVIRKASITTGSKTKMPVGTFGCSCGFVYSRSGPDKNENDQFKRGRIIKFGPLWKDKLLSLTKEGLSIRKVALKLGVDSRTVKSQLLLINTENVQEKKTNSIKLNKNREIWKSLIVSNPGMSVKQLRGLNNTVYMWLYRYDNQWLSEVSIKIKNRIIIKNERIDWQQRDSDLLIEIKGIIGEWKLGDKEKPIKITKTGIANKTLKPHLILGKEDKIPNSTKFIKTVVETDEQLSLIHI
ncbi:TnsD family Tn7-like transposition protein, partial [Bacillus timonensis]